MPIGSIVHKVSVYSPTPFLSQSLGPSKVTCVAHLRRVDEVLASSNHRRNALTHGEAISHAGFIRHYGHCWRQDDPILAIESEVQFGFANQKERNAADAELRCRLGLPASEMLPRKPDALGVLATGDLVVVEVKDEGGSIDRAVVQVAAHMVRFSQLMSTGQLCHSVQSMLGQKRAVGVIPADCPLVRNNPLIQPWIAAPDRSDDWFENWSGAIDGCDDKLLLFLSGLKLVQLSPGGHILDIKNRQSG